MGIKWAPLSVPTQRRLEVLAAFMFIAIILFSELTTIILFGMVFVSCLRLSSKVDLYEVTLIYSSASWWCARQNRLHCLSSPLLSRPKGTRDLQQRARVRWRITFQEIKFNFLSPSSHEFLRGWRLWRYFASYFPLQLIKTVDLPPTRNYVFACFPHGVIRWARNNVKCAAITAEISVVGSPRSLAALKVTQNSRNVFLQITRRDTLGRASEILHRHWKLSTNA